MTEGLARIIIHLMMDVGHDNKKYTEGRVFEIPKGHEFFASKEAAKQSPKNYNFRFDVLTLMWKDLSQSEKDSFVQHFKEYISAYEESIGEILKHVMFPRMEEKDIKYVNGKS